MQEAIKQQLNQLAEEPYRAFTAGLLPGTERILGVRLPRLRQIAGKIVKADWREYLRTVSDASFEEIMLQGMVIGSAPCDLDERLLYITKFVPKIDNWSVCDSFCAGLKFTKDYPQQVWSFLDRYLHSDQEFDIRFAVVMLLFYYTDAVYLDRVLESLDKVHHDGYYVKMAVAWAVSICFVKYPEQTMGYLKDNRLDDFTYNKSLQKITESLKVDSDTKKQIREMKRK